MLVIEEVNQRKMKYVGTHKVSWAFEEGHYAKVYMTLFVFADGL
jgi:hypothetical protein